MNRNKDVPRVWTESSSSFSQFVSQICSRCPKNFENTFTTPFWSEADTLMQNISSRTKPKIRQSQNHKAHKK